ncbi:NMD protein affecting ribosome stability and mRNA decay [Methanomicrobiaceae archaeon CYW5]|uniref:60S ribosomal export protein NMD3 n=1 Tax=Methanovulcanius yangii TaxID=1789227 RepID=UPI0029CA1183|nr:60S ribosomal export protein NMD3 [Methanovulcanius yangii]MBT8507390.1 NMD protein affecting ribosome stability and mRNA decay [Methanovulcanius yangii]
MNIQENFCPKCGGPTTNEGICDKCLAESIDWIVAEQRVVCTFCPTCGSMKQGNTWSDATPNRELLAEELALGALKVHPDVENLHFTVETYEPSPNRTKCIIHAEGTLYGIPVQETREVLVVWKKEQCDRCSRLSGGYYEGVIQVRATDRTPDIHERSRVESIAYSVEDGLQESGERLSFISRIDDIKDGVDVVISSHHIGDLITKQITNELGGKTTRHPKLIGEREGKKLYRITYLVRLPRYRRGDVIEIKNKYYEVRSVESGTIKVFDLQEGIMNVVREDDSYRIIGNVRDAEYAAVSFIDGDMAGILDPKTFMPITIPAYPWLHLSEGMDVRVMEDRENERIFPVG